MQKTLDPQARELLTSPRIQDLLTKRDALSQAYTVTTAIGESIERCQTAQRMDQQIAQAEEAVKQAALLLKQAQAVLAAGETAQVHCRALVMAGDDMYSKHQAWVEALNTARPEVDAMIGDLRHAALVRGEKNDPFIPTLRNIVVLPVDNFSGALDQVNAIALRTRRLMAVQKQIEAILGSAPVDKTVH